MGFIADFFKALARPDEESVSKKELKEILKELEEIEKESGGNVTKLENQSSGGQVGGSSKPVVDRVQTYSSKKKINPSHDKEYKEEKEGKERE